MPSLPCVCINDITQAVDQHKDLEQTKEQIINIFSKTCAQFVDNNLNIHFGQDKTKFRYQEQKKVIGTLDIEYNVRH